MSSLLSIQNNSKIGCCPHGLPQGACPICSGMGGGSSRPGERPQKAGEMSYHQCAMIGAMMRAREARIETHEKNLLNHAEAVKNFEQTMQAISQKIAEFAARISQNLILKPISLIINTTVLPILNAIRSIPAGISSIVEKFNQIKCDIQDKLNAIFGEAKLFVQKKTEELISNIKSKLETLLKVFKRNNPKDDETKIDEEKKIFRLKTFIQKIWKRRKDDTEN
mgnify:CR=1 FL=1